MLEQMRSPLETDGWLLSFDTCGERGSLALFRGRRLAREHQLRERTASATLLSALQAVLAAEGIALGDLRALGVVVGPGSFTGVRVGLAIAKGLTEALGVPLAAVSRLAVLASAAGLEQGVAVLAAGRGQVYSRAVGGTGSDREWLASASDVGGMVMGLQVASGSAELGPVLTQAASVVEVELSARHALEPVLRCLEEGGTDPALADANYVRNEESIYCKVPAGLR